MTKQFCNETDWFNLYGEGWRDIHPDAFAHPAKFSRALIRQIYNHASQWLQPGAVVVDPFGGVALGALEAMRHGYHWTGCELEPRFVGLGNQNIEIWNGLFAGKLPLWGSARLLQGDSRQLANVLQTAEGLRSSPPFGEALAGGGLSAARRGEGNYKVTTRMPGGCYQPSEQGNSDGNLANLRATDADHAATIAPSCPVVVESGQEGDYVSTENTNAAEGRNHRAIQSGQKDSADSGSLWGVRKDGTALAQGSRSKILEGSHERGTEPTVHDRQIDAGTDSREVGCIGQDGTAMAQPSPSQEGLPIGAECLQESARAALRDLWRDRESRGSSQELRSLRQQPQQSANPLRRVPHDDTQESVLGKEERRKDSQIERADRLGKITDGQLGAMKAGAVVSSPPYEGGLGHGGKSATEIDKQKFAYAQEGQMGSYAYGESDGNLGRENGDTFWSASRLILEQCHAILSPGSHAHFVCKDFIRSKKRVPFSDQWQALCESVGFRLTCRHRAWLVESYGQQQRLDGGVDEIEIRRISFFRRLAEKKGSPKIEWEDVICMERA